MAEITRNPFLVLLQENAVHKIRRQDHTCSCKLDISLLSSCAYDPSQTPVHIFYTRVEVYLWSPMIPFCCIYHNRQPFCQLPFRMNPNLRLMYQRPMSQYWVRCWELIYPNLFEYYSHINVYIILR